MRSGEHIWSLDQNIRDIHSTHTKHLPLKNPSYLQTNISMRNSVYWAVLNMQNTRHLHFPTVCFLWGLKYSDTPLKEFLTGIHAKQRSGASWTTNIDCEWSSWCLWHIPASCSLIGWWLTGGGLFYHRSITFHHTASIPLTKVVSCKQQNWFTCIFSHLQSVQLFYICKCTQNMSTITITAQNAFPCGYV